MELKNKCEEQNQFCLFKKYWPRPEQAKGCGLLDPILNPEKESKQGGMPSGHSLLFSFFGTILLFNLFERKVSVYIVAILVSIMILVPISRVNVGCHTKEQVIAGFGIGFISGILIYVLDKYYFRKSKRFETDRMRFYSLF